MLMGVSFIKKYQNLVISNIGKSQYKVRMAWKLKSKKIKRKKLNNDLVIVSSGMDG